MHLYWFILYIWLNNSVLYQIFCIQKEHCVHLGLGKSIFSHKSRDLMQQACGSHYSWLQYWLYSCSGTCKSSQRFPSLFSKSLLLDGGNNLVQWVLKFYKLIFFFLKPASNLNPIVHFLSFKTRSIPHLTHNHISTKTWSLYARPGPLYLFTYFCHCRCNQV